MKTTRKQNTQKGFTLIEIIFYFAIVGIALTAMMHFALQIMNIGRQSENLHELQTAVNLITEKMSYTIKTAESINDVSSTFDNDTGTLSLNTSDVSTTPTRFYLENGNIYMKESNDTPVQLTSNTVTCSQLRFTKITYNKAPDQVTIDALCAPKNVIDLSNAQNITIHTSISLRR